MTCFVRRCKNVRRLLGPESPISFFRFPKDPKVFQQWLEIIGRNDGNVSWSTTKLICSEHFRPEDVLHLNYRKHLKKSAIPFMPSYGIHEDVPDVDEEPSGASPEQSGPFRTRLFVKPLLELTLPEFNEMEKKFGKSGQLIHRQTREIISNVTNFMKSEAELHQKTHKTQIPLTMVSENINNGVKRVNDADGAKNENKRRRLHVEWYRNIMEEHMSSPHFEILMRYNVRAVKEMREAQEMNTTIKSEEKEDGSSTGDEMNTTVFIKNEEKDPLLMIEGIDIKTIDETYDSDL